MTEIKKVVAEEFLCLFSLLLFISFFFFFFFFLSREFCSWHVNASS
jgi:hypothetical protein